MILTVGPDLFRTPGAYFRFLQHLEQSGMLRWERARGRKGALGVFFVKKKDSQLRAIFDTRMLNTHCVDPPKIALPSAAAMASIEAPAGSDFYWGLADLLNAFYCMGVPTNLSSIPHPHPCLAHRRDGSGRDTCDTRGVALAMFDYSPDGVGVEPASLSASRVGRRGEIHPSG